METNVGEQCILWGQPRLPPQESVPALPNFWGSPAFMPIRPLTQNYQIRYGNTYGEGVFLGGRAHGIAFAQMRRAVCQR